MCIEVGGVEEGLEGLEGLKSGLWTLDFGLFGLLQRLAGYQYGFDIWRDCHEGTMVGVEPCRRVVVFD